MFNRANRKVTDWIYSKEPGQIDWPKNINREALLKFMKQPLRPDPAMGTEPIAPKGLVLEDEEFADRLGQCLVYYKLTELLPFLREQMDYLLEKEPQIYYKFALFSPLAAAMAAFNEEGDKARLKKFTDTLLKEDKMSTSDVIHFRSLAKIYYNLNDFESVKLTQGKLNGYIKFLEMETPRPEAAKAWNDKYYALVDLRDKELPKLIKE